MQMIDIEKIISIVRQVVSTTPGIIGFSKFCGNISHIDSQHKNLDQEIEINAIKLNNYEVKVHLISSLYTNLLEVLQKVQNRIKYELENQMDFKSIFKVYVCIEDLIDD